MLCQLGPITLSKGIGFRIFSQISFILVDSHLFLSTFFQFCTMYLNFGSFYASGFLLPSIFALLIFWAAFVFGGSDFGTQLPPKIVSLAKTFFLAFSLRSAHILSVVSVVTFQVVFVVYKVKLICSFKAVFLSGLK